MPNAVKPYSQEELVKIICKGDKAGFSVLFDTYANVFYSIICKACPDTRVGEEILHLSILKIWKSRLAFDPSKQRFLAWMLEIVRDCTRQTLAQKNINKNSEIQTQSNNVFNKDSVLVLIYFKGYSITKAAEVLNCSAEEIKVKLKMELDHIRTTKVK